MDTTYTKSDFLVDVLHYMDVNYDRLDVSRLDDGKYEGRVHDEETGVTIEFHATGAQYRYGKDGSLGVKKSREEYTATHHSMTGPPPDVARELLGLIAHHAWT